MNPAFLAMRVWRRFARLPFIEKPVIVGKDRFRALSFWARRREREMQQTVFQDCPTLEEFFQFSAAMFGPHQIKQEILNFLEFARAEQPEYVCEIGTADGGTNFLLSQALPSVRLMIGVDLYVKNRVQLHYFSKTSQQLIFINGSSYSPSTVERVRRRLAGINLDLLFIDGDHNYDGVKQDFLKYRHLVRDGGLIVFHDIVPDYLTRYGIQTNRWVGGVPLFWSKIKLFYPFYEFVEEPEQDGLGIGAIRYYSHIPIPDDL
jgi:predicted O-methyltransferase YrrM